MSYTSSLRPIYDKIAAQPASGRVADYIPELAKISPDKFGAHLEMLNGRGSQSVGDSHEKFSIQSIAKVFSLSLAYQLLDGKLWERVDVEPSGTPFNSLIQLELENGLPRNPFINAGAIVICDILCDLLDNPTEAMLRFIRDLSGDDSICYNIRVASSERGEGYRNLALANFIRSYGNIENDLDQVLDFYFLLCSVEMNCVELAQSMLYLARGGKNHLGQTILTPSQAKRINAIMLTCGFYDEAGEFAYRVGLPGKSGVGGGIVAVKPEEYAIAVWSPLLNEKGNSCRGMAFLEEFTSVTESSIF